MDNKQQHKRLRLLLSKLNKERKLQSKKIDILCNDIVAAQRDFIKRLNTISFAADFYEVIVGTFDLNGLLYTATKSIKNEFPDLNIAFFLHRQDNFEMHLFESDEPIDFEKQSLDNCFTPELVKNICKSNKLCTLDCLFAMGLQGNLNQLNKISAVTIPLGRFSSSLGFILIYRSAQNKLAAAELHRISAVTSGLSQAIESCYALSPSTD